MSKKIILLVKASWNGNNVPAGTELEVNDESAAALVRDGAAKVVEELAGEQVLQDPPQDPLAVDMQRKALDAQYKKDDLIEAAKAAGVEFPYDATKAIIIEAVIAAGKAEALLK